MVLCGIEAMSSRVAMAERDGEGGRGDRGDTSLSGASAEDKLSLVSSRIGLKPIYVEVIKTVGKRGTKLTSVQISLLSSRWAMV